MTREWDEKQAGKRPVVQEELYLSYIKEIGTSSNQIHNRKHPFVLPGLGSPGQHCMCKKVSGIGLDGKKLGYTNLRCKRIECPNCFSNWVLDWVFDVAFKIEAYAKVTGQRPAHVTSEIIGVNRHAENWNLDDYDTFHRRTYRHISAIGGEGGLRMLHPYRVHKELKEQLKKVGYGVQGNGFWRGVRDNALQLDSYDDYTYLSPHDHLIIFPEFLKEHSDSRFFVKKIGTLEHMEDVVKLAYYLISHCGVFKDGEEKDNHPIVFFGTLHRFNPAKYLTLSEITELKKRIAEMLHCSFDEGTLKPLSDDKQSNADQFIPIHEFAIYSGEKEDWVSAIVSSFPGEYQAFWWEIIQDYNAKLNDKTLKSSDKCLMLDDIRVPDGIEIIEVV